MKNQSKVRYRTFQLSRALLRVREAPRGHRDGFRVRPRGGADVVLEVQRTAVCGLLLTDEPRARVGPVVALKLALRLDLRRLN